jgi:pilus assembly protein CpaC
VVRSSGRELGINIRGFNAGNIAFTTNPSAALSAAVPGERGTPFGTLVAKLLEIAGVQIDVVINALEAKGAARRLANPSLIAMSGSEANFLVGGEVPIQSSVTGQNGNVATEINYREFGVRLTFAPIVLDDGLINLKVNAEVSDIDQSINVNGNPGFTTRKAETTVELRDGQSFAIAGLLQATNDRSISQLPWLGNLPVLGALFRSTNFQKKESDLVIVVSPRIVRPAAPGEPLNSPLDKARSSDDVELFLLGMLEVDKKMIRRFHDGDGIVGPYGHIIDLEFNDELVIKK